MRENIQSNYPKTVAEILDDSIEFLPGVLAAMKAFRASRPWRTEEAGHLPRELDKLNRLLAAAYSINPPRLVFSAGGRSNGLYLSQSHAIVLAGHISLITYLHCFARALGENRYGACRWSINLFRKIFPRSYGRLRPVGLMLVRA